MKVKTMNLFIVGVDEPVLSTLYQYLRNKSGNSLNIFNFSTLKGCFKKIDKRTSLVLIGSLLSEKNETEISNRIHQLNSKTCLVKMSSHSDAGEAIDKIRQSAQAAKNKMAGYGIFNHFIAAGKAKWKGLSQNWGRGNIVALIAASAAGIATIIFLIVKSLLQ